MFAGRLGRRGDGLVDVGGQLDHVVGDGRRGVDREVDDDVGPERLSQLDGRRDAPLGRCVGHERRVLHVLRTDAEDDRAAGVAAQRGPLGQDLVGDRHPGCWPSSDDHAAVGRRQGRARPGSSPASR